jgi:protein gp37
MAERTEISWAHSTFNPWIGCTKVSPGCDHCYAATLMDDRYGRVKWGPGEARSRTKTWGEPVRWNKLAAASGEPWRVFCASLADVFDNEVDPAWRLELGHLIWQTPALTWMLLTKRIGRVDAVLRDFNWTHFPKNVWLGITVVNQEEADRDIPKLLKARAAVRWLSCEPLLGPISFEGRWVDHKDPAMHENWLEALDWVIVGGESGKGARPMDPQWALDLRDQCAATGTAFHFKQWGGVRPKDGGHLLDGVEHRAFPQQSSTGGGSTQEKTC